MNPMTRRHTWTRLACALSLGVAAFAAQATRAPCTGPRHPRLGLRPRLQRRQQRTRRVGRSTSLNDVAPLGSSDFKFLPPGSYTAQVGQQSLPVKLDPDSYYTLVSQPGGKPQLVAEPPFKNKQKALVRVQNLSGSKLTLKTADGKTDVVKDVGPQSHGDREINPVKVNLALFDGSKKVSDLKPVTLARGEVVCLYVTGSGGKLAPVWVKRPVKAD